jgi:hypothetical protein
MRLQAIVRRLVLAFAALTLTTACASNNSNNNSITGLCTAVRSIAVSVTVRDSISGRAIANIASGTLHLGTMVDTLAHVDSLTLDGGQALGTYSVTVAHTGYRTWTQANVVVSTLGACGNVQPVNLNARLQADSP